MNCCAFSLVCLVSLATLGQPAATNSSTSPPASLPPPATENSMQHMAESLTSMAEMCKMMMQREMAALPFKIAAGVLLGTLLTVALILFIILEVQWIRYWSRKLRAQRISGESLPVSSG